MVGAVHLVVDAEGEVKGGEDLGGIFQLSVGEKAPQALVHG